MWCFFFDVILQQTPSHPASSVAMPLMWLFVGLFNSVLPDSFVGSDRHTPSSRSSSGKRNHNKVFIPTRCSWWWWRWWRTPVSLTAAAAFETTFIRWVCVYFVKRTWRNRACNGYYSGPNVILIPDQVLQSFISRRAYQGLCRRLLIPPLSCPRSFGRRYVNRVHHHC